MSGTRNLQLKAWEAIDRKKEPTSAILANGMLYNHRLVASPPFSREDSPYESVFNSDIHNWSECQNM